MNKQSTRTQNNRSKIKQLLFKPFYIGLVVLVLLGVTAVTFTLDQTQKLHLESGSALEVTCNAQGLNIEITSRNALRLVCPSDGTVPTPTARPPLAEDIIYVSTTGNDDWPGTLDQPLRTIQMGVDLASAGKTVYVREGTYYEQVIISTSGTSTSPITVSAYPGETPIIDGQYDLPSHNGDWGGCNNTVSPPTCFNYEHLVSIEGDYIVLDGFEIRHSLGRGVAVYKYNGSPTGAIIKNNNVHSNRDVGILMHEAKNVTIENNDISYNSNFATHHRGAGEMNWSAGAVSVRSDNIVYRGNTIHNNWGEGVITGNYAGSTNITIEDNVFYDNYALQIYVHRSHNVNVERNLVYCTDDSRFFRGSDRTFGLVVANEPPPEGFSDGLRTRDIDILNNIVTGCRQNFAVWGSDSAAEDYRIINMLVAHNTFVNAVSTSGPDQAENVLWTNYNYENVRFENNIIYQQDGIPINLLRDYPGLTLENNLWSSPPVFTAAGSGDIVDDPQLVYPNAPIVPGQVDAAWYKLQSSSPAIGAAEKTNGITNDFFGNSRGNNSDIGAHERQ